MFDVSTSLVFKEQKVVRFYDKKRNALVYLTYSTKLVDGSYKSAVSAVPIMPWDNNQPVCPVMADPFCCNLTTHILRSTHHESRRIQYQEL